MLEIPSSIPELSLMSITIGQDGQLLTLKAPGGLGSVVWLGPIQDCQRRSVPSTGRHSRTRALGVELETRGLEGAQKAFDAVEALGLIPACIAFKGAEEYDRAELWICYEQAYEPARLQAQGVALLNYAGLRGNVLYATDQSNCPPLGLYHSPDVQGMLLSPTGHRFDIGNAAGRTSGILILEALPRTVTPPPPMSKVAGHNVTTCGWTAVGRSGCSHDRDSVRSARHVSALGYDMRSDQGGDDE